MRSKNSEMEISDNAKGLKVKQKSKKSVGLLVFIFSFVVLLGIESGMWGAYYVIKTGWENIPFAEKMEFLPIVKLDKPISENFEEPTVESALEPASDDSEKATEDIKTNSD